MGFKVEFNSVMRIDVPADLKVGGESRQLTKIFKRMYGWK